MVLLKLTVQMARIKIAEILENIFAVDVKITFPIHGILLRGTGMPISPISAMPLSPIAI